MEALTAGETAPRRSITGAARPSSRRFDGTEQGAQEYVNQGGTRGRLTPLDCHLEINGLRQRPRYLFHGRTVTQYAPVTEDMFSAVDRGGSHAITSVLTLLEVLVRPIRSGLIELAHKSHELLPVQEGSACSPSGAETCRTFSQAASEV